MILKSIFSFYDQYVDDAIFEYYKNDIKKKNLL